MTRLQVLDSGLHPLQQMQFKLINRIVGHAPGPIATLSYRREWFGRYYNDLCQEAMRGATEWRKYEVELFAAFVSSRNQCRYCTGAHSAIAVQGLDQATVDAVLADWRSAPLNQRERVTLGFLEKLTLEPDAVTADDIESLRQAGLNDTAIKEAITVCFLFCLINRLADAFEFEVPDAPSYNRLGFVLYNMGYGLGSLPG
jgi:uncharacterized peroxidase-related enzyme